MSDVVPSSEYMFASKQKCVIQHMNYYNKLMETNNQADINQEMRGLEDDTMAHDFTITFISIVKIMQNWCTVISK